jgi:Asp-tRNA(Asn)/Glu-tRNA(Gln) amidotransferase C subunit
MPLRVQISNLAKLVKLDKQHTAKIKSDTNEFAETLKQRILFLESQSRAQFDKLEDHMTRLDTMYSAFPADAAAISQIGGAQPQGLPGFIATYIHSLFTQHTQSTAASLTQQAQTHQIHLQNWVQEYIKVRQDNCTRIAVIVTITTARTHANAWSCFRLYVLQSTHPSSKLLDEVNSFKLELHTMNAKQSDSESRLISLVEKRMSGYTEIYTTMEERFLSVVDTHHRKITDQVQAYEARMEDMQRVLEENVSMATTTANESSQLRSDVDAQRGSTQEFLQLLEEMKSKLDAGLVDFNAHINALVLELREKTWHAEQTCSRLAVDTISRQNAFSKKLEQQIGEQQTALQQEMQTHIQRAGEAATELRSNVAAFEKRMEKLSKKTDNRIQILANTLKDRFESATNTHNASAPCGMSETMLLTCP